MLSNSVLLDVGEPSIAAINEIEDMNMIEDYNTDYQQTSSTDSEDSNSSHGDANKQVIFLLFLKWML